MSRVREACIIEEEMQALIEAIADHRSAQDLNCEQLIQQNSYDDLQSNLRLKETIGVHSNNQFNAEVNYFKEFWRYYIMNEVFIKKINELGQYNNKLTTLADDLEDLQQEYSQSIQQRNKKKNRRTSQEIQKSFVCPYERCNKQYGSDVSLNLHIKLKHEGGNKTDREKYAKMIIQAQENGDSLPDVGIKFPPGYLDQFKEQLRKEKTLKPKKERVTIFHDDS